MEKSESLILAIYHEAEREAIEFIAELQSSIALNTKLAGQIIDDMDRLLLQECTWRLREMIDDVIKWAQYRHRESNRLEELLAESQDEGKTQNGSAGLVAG